MATQQYKVTLSDEVAAFLRSEDSRGRLSEGIDRFVHRIRTQTPTVQTKPAHHKLENAFNDDKDDPEVDPRNLNGNKATAGRLLREDIEKARLLAIHRANFREACVKICIGTTPEKHLPLYMEDYAKHLATDDMWSIYEETKADANGSVAREGLQYWTELNALNEKNEAEALNYKMLLAVGKTPAEAMRAIRPDQKPQTLRLSVKALKGMGLFGTPEALTDEQIQEVNAEWENKDAPVDLEE